MIATLVDRSDGLPSLEKSIITLVSAGFDKALINKHVEKVHETFLGNGHFRPKE